MPRGPWNLLDSWDRLGEEAMFGIRGHMLSLAQVPMTHDPETGNEAVDWDAARPEVRAVIEASDMDPAWWSDRVRLKRDDLRQRRFVTGHEVRATATQELRTRGDSVLGPLKSRFSEILVDEVQDCSITDLFIIQKAHASGIPVVLVGDPDQCIYQWRDASPDSMQKLVSEIGETVAIDHNRRSTPAICQLAATLRTGRRRPDQPVGEHRSSTVPVFIVPTAFTKEGPRHHRTGDLLLSRFEALAKEHGIDPADCLVTSVAKQTLPGRRSGRARFTNIDRLAEAWRTLHDASSTPELLESVVKVGGRHLSRYWYPRSLGTLDDISTKHALTPIDAMRHGYAFLAALPQPSTGWSGVVNKMTEAWPRPDDVQPGQSGLLRSEPTGVSNPARRSDAPFRFDNIHQVKGQEAEAVLLLLPDAAAPKKRQRQGLPREPELDVVTRWTHGDAATDETLRLWYVAVTRARQLLVIAVPTGQERQLLEFLRSRNVHCELN